MTWKVYIIEATSGHLYTGITNNLEKRLADHAKKKGARYFHFSSPKQVVFTEDHPDRSSASRRESAIKKMTRAEKIQLMTQAHRKNLGTQ